jgi:ubiquinone/menaquinone biosynthesis C-methylase UbiE
MTDKSKGKFAKYFDLLIKKDYKQEVSFLDFVFKRFGNVNKIIDLGCGTGNHAILLTKMGYKVVGVDIDADMIQVASEKVEKENLYINFLKQDMKDLNVAEKFDAAISMWAAFQEVIKYEDIKKTLNNVHDALNDGGIFVLDLENPDMIIKYHQDFSIPSVMKAENIKIVLFYNKRLDLQNKLLSVVAIGFIEDEGKLSLEIEDNNLRILFLDDVLKLLKEAHFEVIDVLGNYNLTEKFDSNKRRMLFIARKLK